MSNTFFSDVPDDIVHRHIMWTNEGTPFIQIGKRTLMCHHGRDKNPKRQPKNPPVFKTRNKLKLACKEQIIVCPV